MKQELALSYLRHRSNRAHRQDECHQRFAEGGCFAIFDWALHHYAFQQRVFAGEFFFVLPRGFGGRDLPQAAVADPVEDAGEFVGVAPQAVRFTAVDQHAAFVAEVLPCHQLAAHRAGAVTLAGRRERFCRRTHQRRFDLWRAVSVCRGDRSLRLRQLLRQ